MKAALRAVPDRGFALPLWATRILGWMKGLFVANDNTLNRRPLIARVARRPRAKPEEFGQGYYFRDAILDQLDAYFAVLATMKTGDRDAYDYFSKVGANLLPDHAQMSGDALEPWFVKTLPTQGAAMMSHTKKVDEVKGELIPRMMYFTKYKPSARPVAIQPFKGAAIYLCALYYEDVEKGRPGVPLQFPVAVSPDGKVHVLKVHQSRGQQVQMRRRGGSQGGSFCIPTRAWDIPRVFKDWAAEKGRSPEEFLRWIFIITANIYVAANGEMTRIEVSRRNLKAAFAVNVERTPYFFKDRDVKDGRKKKIFHIVRGHERVTDSGVRTVVRTHFRGEREFDWNGYSVRITVPGWHHIDFAGLNVEVLDADSREAVSQQTKSTAEVAHLLAEAVASGRGGYKRRPPDHRRAI